MKMDDGMGFRDGLPPELAELDAELSGISLDERSSFGPELRNELARAWAEPAPVRRPGWVRTALAASLAAVAFTGLVVPPARASLTEGMQRIFLTLRSGGEETVTLDEVLFSEETSAALRAAGVEAAAPAPVPALPGEQGEAVRLPPFRPGTSSYPTLADPSAERDLVRRY